MERFLNESLSFRNQLLTRLVADCIYYIGCPEWSEKQLWGESVTKHTGDMQALYRSFPCGERPKWISLEEVDAFCTKMLDAYCERKALVWVKKYDDEMRYQLLGRMRSDCDYFLGAGNYQEDVLWAKSVKHQIIYMKVLYNSFLEDEKPEWISMKEIDEYEAAMSNRR